MPKRVVTVLIALIVVGLAAATIYFTTRNDHRQPVGHHVVPSGGPDEASAPDCGPGKQVLANSPVAVKDLSTIIPLGNFAPPGHIGPTPHMYYNYLNTGTSSNPNIAKTNIYAPADMTITKISLFDNKSSPTPFDSYRVDFSICKQVSGYFIHTLSLSDKLAAIMKPPYDNTQESAITGTVTEHVYSKKVSIKIAAGEQVGTGGGNAHAPWGLDFGLVDRRTAAPVMGNQARWTDDSHYVCSLDYYPAGLSATLYAHIGDYTYKYLEPGSPKCGVMYPDIPGTAQGEWFTRDVPTGALGDPAMEITLAPSNLNHAQDVFALGSKLESIGISTTALHIFTPRTSGLVDTDFGQVKPDGGVHCYQLKDQADYTRPDVLALLQLTNATTLKFGKGTGGTCGSGPWPMPANAVEYIR
jgi:hypothetical protein